MRRDLKDLKTDLYAKGFEGLEDRPICEGF